MTKELLIVNGLIMFYIIQRLSEMLISRDHEIWSRTNLGAMEVDKTESKMMKLFHTFWFISLIIEANQKMHLNDSLFSIGIYLVLALCLSVRLHSMKILKKSWNIKILSNSEKQHISTEGLYRFVRHPNYLIVILELIFIPLLFNAYFTLVLFSIGNLFILQNRIRLEEAELMKNSNYRKHFMNKKRFIPYVFSFLLIFFSLGQLSELKAEELKWDHAEYKQAKGSDQFVKFESTSTKLGFITTSFDGYAKKVSVHYERKNELVTNLKVEIPVDQLDTDLSARNEKMLKEILAHNTHPTITVQSMSPITLKEGQQEVELVYVIKGQSTTKKTTITMTKQDQIYLIKGHTSVGLKELNLPDPSIAIAKVRDLFDLSFAIKM
jgi:methyltransferase